MLTVLEKASKADIQIVAQAYNITESEAERWLQNEVPSECPSCWPFLVVGLAMGGILGTGFAMILKKGE